MFLPRHCLWRWRYNGCLFPYALSIGQRWYSDDVHTSTFCSSEYTYFVGTTGLLLPRYGCDDSKNKDRSNVRKYINSVQMTPFGGSIFLGLVHGQNANLNRPH